MTTIKEVRKNRIYGGIRKGDWYSVKYLSGFGSVVWREYRVEQSPDTVKRFVESAQGIVQDNNGFHIVYKDV